MFGHVAAWRERFLEAAAAGTDPPADVNDLNDSEIPGFAHEPTASGAARAGAAFDRIIEVVNVRGAGQPLRWYALDNLGEAALRVGIGHPGQHFVEHLLELGQLEEAAAMAEQILETFTALRLGPPIRGGWLYNLAVLRVKQSRLADARQLLDEALRGRPDLAEAAGSDPDLAPLRDHSA